jgi:hypothetical protein
VLRRALEFGRDLLKPFSGLVPWIGHTRSQPFASPGCLRLDRLCGSLYA